MVKEFLKYSLAFYNSHFYQIFYKGIPYRQLPDFFEALYQENSDPWQFETSEYEAQKYATRCLACGRGSTIAVLQSVPLTMNTHTGAQTAVKEATTLDSVQALRALAFERPVTTRLARAWNPAPHRRAARI